MNRPNCILAGALSTAFVFHLSSR